jgi:hypothetical protein
MSHQMMAGWQSGLFLSGSKRLLSLFMDKAKHLSDLRVKSAFKVPVPVPPQPVRGLAAFQVFVKLSAKDLDDVLNPRFVCVLQC